jgi:hypothetical protein
LRFVALVAGGWASARILILWPYGASAPEAIETVRPIERLSADAGALRRAPAEAAEAAFRQPALVSRLLPSQRVAPAIERTQFRLAELEYPRPLPAQILGAPPGTLPESTTPAMLPISAPPVSRWSASGWFVTRRGAPAAGTMLGGDQIGLRIAYALTGGQQLRAYLRGTAPLSVPGREVAVGIEWQPTDLPLRLVGEHRFGLDGIRGGPAIAVTGGVNAADLPLDLELDAYGQAGAVWRGRIDPFADGALRVTHEVASIGKARLSLGGGIWGAAQRDAARLDVGPSAVATLPLAGQPVKLSIDWRQRVAGNARPGSGPALTLGADF